MLISLRSLTVKLQKKTNDILSAYEHMSQLYSWNWNCLNQTIKKNFISGLEKSRPWLKTLTYLLVHPVLLRGKFTEQIFQLTALKPTIEETS